MAIKKQLMSIGALAVGLVVSTAHASPVVTTFATDSTWDAAGYKGETSVGAPYAGAASIVTPSGGWIDESAFGPDAHWIGVQADNGQVGYAGTQNGSGVYVFTKELSLVPPPAGGSSVVLDFSFSADNYLNGLEISSAGHNYIVSSSDLITLQSGPPNTNGDYYGGGNKVYSFEYKWNLHDTGAFTSPVVITATVQNFFADVNLDPGNPVGFIASGSLSYSAVPLPASASLGFGMLAGFGGLFAVRRRLRRSPRITV